MELSISSVGMVSSVGGDFTTSCASILADMRRPESINHLSVYDDETFISVPATGYPILGITDGFSPVGRWIEMGVLAFSDLIQWGKLPDIGDSNYWGNTGLILVTPILDDFRFVFTPTVTLDNIRKNYLYPLLKRLGYPVAQEKCSVISKGHAGVIFALDEAQSKMNAWNVERLVILAVDSYLDATSLRFLSENGRLKNDDEPTGLMPGEAGVALLIEKSSTGLVQISATATGLEKHNIYTDAHSQGQVLSQVITKVLRNANTEKYSNLSAYTDINGENWRAYEFSVAINLSCSELSLEYSVITPAQSIGDTGAASGAISIALHIHKKLRKFLNNSNSIILSSSDCGDVGALILV